MPTGSISKALDILGMTSTVTRYLKISWQALLFLEKIVDYHKHWITITSRYHFPGEAPHPYLQGSIKIAHILTRNEKMQSCVHILPPVRENTVLDTTSLV